MANPKGNPNLPPGKGRIPGSKNKFPIALKEKVLHAAARLEAEGKDLGQCAADNPQWFWENFVKPMLPKDVNVDVKGNVKVSLTVVKHAAPTD